MMYPPPIFWMVHDHQKKKGVPGKQKMSSLAAMLEPLSVQHQPRIPQGSQTRKSAKGLPRKLRRHTALPCQRSVCDQLWHLRRNNVVEFPDKRTRTTNEEETKQKKPSDVVDAVQSYHRHLAW